MKIIRRKTQIFEFDYDEELKRLKSCFKGKQLQRQLAILDAVFKDKNLEKAQELIDKLPYCKKNECPEAEYVGSWICIFTGGWGEFKCLVDSETTFEY